MYNLLLYYKTFLQPRPPLRLYLHAPQGLSCFISCSACRTAYYISIYIYIYIYLHGVESIAFVESIARRCLRLRGQRTLSQTTALRCDQRARFPEVKAGACPPHR